MTFSVGPVEQFLIFEGADEACSDPNIAGHTSCCFYSGDVLVSFATPATSVSITSDLHPAAVKGSDIVRLVALITMQSPFEFEIVAIHEGLDDQTSCDSAVLSVSAPRIDAVVFQATTEYEGFDNLSFD